MDRHWKAFERRLCWFGWGMLVGVLLCGASGCQAMRSALYGRKEGIADLPAPPEPALLLKEKSTELLQWSERSAQLSHEQGAAPGAPGTQQAADAIRTGRALLGEPARALPGPDVTERVPEVDKAIETVEAELGALHKEEHEFEEDYNDFRRKSVTTSWEIGSGLLNQLLLYGGIGGVLAAALWVLRSRGSLITALVGGVQAVRERFTKGDPEFDARVKDVLRAHQDESQQKAVNRIKEKL